jgi:hypothetical protein
MAAVDLGVGACQCGCHVADAMKVSRVGDAAGVRLSGMLRVQGLSLTARATATRMERRTRARPKQTVRRTLNMARARGPVERTGPNAGTFRLRNLEHVPRQYLSTRAGGPNNAGVRVAVWRGVVLLRSRAS